MQRRDHMKKDRKGRKNGSELNGLTILAVGPGEGFYGSRKGREIDLHTWALQEEMNTHNI